MRCVVQLVFATLACGFAAPWVAAAAPAKTSKLLQYAQEKAQQVADPMDKASYLAEIGLNQAKHPDSREAAHATLLAAAQSLEQVKDPGTHPDAMRFQAPKIAKGLIQVGDGPAALRTLNLARDAAMKIAHDRDDWTVIGNVTALYFLSGDRENALQTYTSVSAELAKQPMGKQFGNLAYYALGLAREGDNEAALTVARKLQDMAATAPPGAKDFCSWRITHVLITAGDQAGAEARAATIKDPQTSDDAWGDIVFGLTDVAKFDEALKAAEQIKDLKTRQSSIASIVRAMAQVRKLDLAEKTAASMQPSSGKARAYRSLTGCYLIAGDKAAAKKALDLAIENDAADPKEAGFAEYETVILKAKLGDSEPAKAYAEKQPPQLRSGTLALIRATESDSGDLEAAEKVWSTLDGPDKQYVFLSIASRKARSSGPESKELFAWLDRADDAELACRAALAAAADLFPSEKLIAPR